MKLCFLGKTIRYGGRLFQQYVVDAFSSIENSRLYWHKQNQSKLRNELYHNLVDLVSHQDVIDSSNVGQPILLPASFVGSARYMQQNFLDALTVCAKIGYPDLFLTMTCNPYCDEIKQMMSILPPHLNPEDCPDIIARVFKLKLDQLCDDIKNRNFFGECISGIMKIIRTILFLLKINLFVLLFLNIIQKLYYIYVLYLQ